VHGYREAYHRGDGLYMLSGRKSNKMIPCGTGTVRLLVNGIDKVLDFVLRKSDRGVRDIPEKEDYVWTFPSLNHPSLRGLLSPS